MKIYGLDYKIGIRGKVFFYVNGHWVLSSKTPNELKNEQKEWRRRKPTINNAG